jgi:predicted small metal-binding protein
MPVESSEAMAKIITCECGHVVRADADDELLLRARAHIAEAHEEMIGTVTDDELLAMATEL